MRTGGSAIPSAALCVWHPAVDTHPTMGPRHSSLKLPHGQEKDSSAYITASTKSGSSSCARCQSTSDVTFPMENTLHEGVGSTPDPRRALVRVHYIRWSIWMQTICCKWPCPRQCGPNLVCTSWPWGPKRTHYIFLSLPVGPDIAFNTAQGKHMSSSSALINKMWLD